MSDPTIETAPDLQVSLPESCDWCPRLCRANRAAGERGRCGADGTLRIARAALHYWEEPCLSGKRGSGTIFFSNCPLDCCYCQNALIATGEIGREITVQRLSDICLELQEQGALNINMVTPTHYAEHIRVAVADARARGLSLPVVYNTSGYETVKTVKAAADTCDIWLTDFKYISPVLSARLSFAPTYTKVAQAALDAMVEQTGEAVFDEVDGAPRMLRGVIVRHLMLPGHLDDSMAVVRLLHERYGDAVRLSLMNQYTPIITPDTPAAQRYPELLERVPKEDYERLLDFADSLGISDYYWQDGEAAAESFIPEFDYTGV